MLALIDTGASRSLIRHDVAVKLMKKMRKTPEFQPADCVLTSVTGHGINIEGMMEVIIPGVGLITLYVIRDMTPQCLIGIDQLYRHDFTLTGGGLHWGEAVFRLVSTPQEGGAYLALAAVHPTTPQSLPPGKPAIRISVSQDHLTDAPTVPAVYSSHTKDSHHRSAPGTDNRDQ